MIRIVFTVGSIVDLRLATRVAYDVLGNGSATFGYIRRRLQQLCDVHARIKLCSGEVPGRFEFIELHHRSDAGKLMIEESWRTFF